MEYRNKIWNNPKRLLQWGGALGLFSLAILSPACSSEENYKQYLENTGELTMPKTSYTGTIGLLNPADTTAVSVGWSDKKSHTFQLVLGNTENTITVSIVDNSAVNNYGVHTLALSEKLLVDAIKTMNLEKATEYSLALNVIDQNTADTVTAKIALTSVTTLANPIYASGGNDPSWMRDDNGIFYVVSGSNLLSTSNFKNWTSYGNVMPSKPTWQTDPSVWAGELNKVNGKYYLYYALSNSVGDGWKTGIGVAIADKITGPYIDHRKLVDAREAGVMNSIDPCFYDDGENKYIFWGSAWGFWAYELSDDGLSIKPGTSIHQISVVTYSYNKSLLEGVMIHKHGDYYYLFGSIGDTSLSNGTSSYAMVVTRSKDILGPYVDKQGNRLLDGTNYEVINQSSSLFAGPGHNSEIMTDDDGNDWVLYHAYDQTAGNGVRALMMSQVKWVDGWPVINDGTPPAVTDIPYFKTVHRAPIVK